MTVAELAENQEVEKETYVRLKSWDEAEEVLRKHLKPTHHGPKGQPVYSLTEIHELLERLNIRFPEDL